MQQWAEHKLNLQQSSLKGEEGAEGEEQEGAQQEQWLRHVAKHHPHKRSWLRQHQARMDHPTQEVLPFGMA